MLEKKITYISAQEIKETMNKLNINKLKKETDKM
jgi:hypothetical protein